MKPALSKLNISLAIDFASAASRETSRNWEQFRGVVTLKHKRTHTTNRMSNFARADQAHLEEAGMVGGMTAKYTETEGAF